MGHNRVDLDDRMNDVLDHQSSRLEKVFQGLSDSSTLTF